MEQGPPLLFEAIVLVDDVGTSRKTLLDDAPPVVPQDPFGIASAVQCHRILREHETVGICANLTAMDPLGRIKDCRIARQVGGETDKVCRWEIGKLAFPILHLLYAARPAGLRDEAADALALGVREDFFCLPRQLEVPRLDVIADGGPVGDEQDGEEDGHYGRSTDHGPPSALLHRAPA